MANSAGDLAQNLAVTANIVGLAVKTLGLVSDQDSEAVTIGSRETLTQLIVQQLGNELRNKAVEK